MKIKTNLPRVMAIMAVLGIISVFSCKKESSSKNNVSDTEAVITASSESAQAESVFDDVFDNVAGVDDATAGVDLGLYGSTGFGIFNEQAGNGSVSTPGIGTNSTEQIIRRCFTVTVDPREPGVFPKTVTIDFGTGCESRHHVRKGKIIITYTGKLHIPGSKAITTFDNYYIDSFKVEGTHTLENTSSPGGNERSFTVTISDAKITNTNNGEWVGWSSTKVFTQVEGNSTPWWPVDDVFNISGSTNGESSSGKTWSAEITDPLVKKFTCRWIVDGTIKIKLNDTEGVLEYGDGDCDNTATITVNGETRTITLR